MLKIIICCAFEIQTELGVLNFIWQGLADQARNLLSNQEQREEVSQEQQELGSNRPVSWWLREGGPSGHGAAGGLEGSLQGPGEPSRRLRLSEEQPGAAALSPECLPANLPPGSTEHSRLPPPPNPGRRPLLTGCQRQLGQDPCFASPGAITQHSAPPHPQQGTAWPRQTSYALFVFVIQK